MSRRWEFEPCITYHSIFLCEHCGCYAMDVPQGQWILGPGFCKSCAYPGTLVSPNWLNKLLGKKNPKWISNKLSGVRCARKWCYLCHTGYRFNSGLIKLSDKYPKGWSLSKEEQRIKDWNNK